MLGRTNITALSEGGIVTEVEDFRWVQMPSGVYGNFVKVTCKDGRLVAITADGSVVHTVDGEAWEASGTGFADCVLKDIEWDGDRFLLVGSCTEDGRKAGLILSTKDFVEYERIHIVNCDDTEQDYDEEYCGSYFTNGRYCIAALRKKGTMSLPYMYIADLRGGMEPYAKVDMSSTYESVQEMVVAKNSDGMLLCFKVYYKLTSSSKYIDKVYRLNIDGSYNRIYSLECDRGPMLVNVFECKDALFYEAMVSSGSYDLVKVLPSNEKATLCTGQNFAFTDGVYFDGSQLFINNHGMLVVRKGESIADKTVEDLIEIAPEMTMRCIAKAFGQLYIFGNHGAILRSSVETGNEEAIVVQTISAKKALADAKAYADRLYQELEARVAALEAGA